MHTKDNGTSPQASTPPAGTPSTAQVVGPPSVKDPQGGLSPQQTARLNQMLAGHVEPPNEYAEYIVQQLREVISRGQQIGQRLTACRSQSKTLEEEGLRLEGVADQLLRDLSKWDRPPTNPLAGASAPPQGEIDETTS
jgi:hypothetical protein